MASKVIPKEIKNKGKFTAWSALGIIIIKMTAKKVPTMIKGVLLPIRVSTRSDHAPNNGRRNKASTLSTAIMAPVRVSPNWKVFFNINGIMLS